MKDLNIKNFKMFYFLLNYLKDINGFIAGGCFKNILNYSSF